MFLLLKPTSVRTLLYTVVHGTPITIFLVEVSLIQCFGDYYPIEHTQWNRKSHQLFQHKSSTIDIGIYKFFFGFKNFNCGFMFLMVLVITATIVLHSSCVSNHYVSHYRYFSDWMQITKTRNLNPVQVQLFSYFSLHRQLDSAKNAQEIITCVSACARILQSFVIDYLKECIFRNHFLQRY